MVRVQLPAAAPMLYRLRVSTRPSLQNSAHSGQHGGSLPFSFWGRGRQAMHLLCKQVDVGALPTDSTILRSEPTSSWVRVKDALHSLRAKEGASVRLRAMDGRPISINCGELD